MVSSPNLRYPGRLPPFAFCFDGPWPVDQVLLLYKLVKAITGGAEPLLENTVDWMVSTVTVETEYSTF